MASPDLRPLNIDTAKEVVLGQSDPLAGDPSGPSQLIVDSWIRSKEALGMPERVRDVPVVDLDLLDDSLLDLLHTPMESFARSLDGTGVGLLLADQQGRILDRWSPSLNGLEHLDRVGTVRGAVLAEDTVGTNGVGTVIATRKLTQVIANEHFSEFYRTAACTGAPLFHPITGELLGAVTLSCDVAPHTDLLQALIRTLTANLEQHMMSMEQPGTRQLLDEFMRMTRNGSVPVIGFGAQGLLVQNSSASQFSPVDFQLIRQAAADADSRGRATGETSLGKVDLKIERFPGAGNILVRVTPSQQRTATVALPRLRETEPLVGRSSGWRDTLKQISRARTTSSPLLIAGEQGSGKTSLAVGHAYRPAHPAHDVAVMDASVIPVVGTRRWFERLEQHLEEQHRLVIRNIDTPEPRTLAGLRSVIAAVPEGNRVTLTATVGDEREARDLSLTLGTHLVTAPPLRERSTDIAALWNSFVERERPGSDITLSPEALRSLQHYSWPGNLGELQRTVSEVLSRHKAGPVELEVLPEDIRSPRTTGLIERAEEEAIRRALLEAGGNRQRAAEILGVSRATVYRKMKSYKLSS
ncbi:MAG: helix-turn-helix domain-containing protein [Leucobacter sp.]